MTFFLNICDFFKGKDMVVYGGMLVCNMDIILST